MKPTSEENPKPSSRALNGILLLLGVGVVLLTLFLNRSSALFGDLPVSSAFKHLDAPLLEEQKQAIYQWLLIDCVFALVYTLFFYLLCRKATSFFPEQFRMVGWCLGVLIVACGAADLLENLLLWLAVRDQKFFSALPFLGVLKWGGPAIGGGFFLYAHQRRTTILRFAAGILVLLVLLTLVVRLFCCHVGHYPGVASSSVNARLQSEIKTNLIATIETLSASGISRNPYEPYASNLNAAALWINYRFQSNGYHPSNVVFSVADSNKYSFGAVLQTEGVNIVAQRNGASNEAGIIIVGAHYDTMAGSDDWTGVKTNKFVPGRPGTPGANDNASGIAALIEIARLFTNVAPKLTVRFVAFANEEPPFFQKTNAMGSYLYAQSCKERGERIVMMISLDALAVYDPTNRNSSKRAGIQGAAASFLGLVDAPNYVAFMSNWEAHSGLKAKEWAETFSKHSPVAVRTVSLPYISGEVFAWSDDWSFTRHDYPAFTVTDTAFYRSPRYHELTDTFKNLSEADFEAFSEVVYGLSEMLKEMAMK